MNFTWEPEHNLYHEDTRDWNLETVEEHPQIIAFVRLYELDNTYVCRFMAMPDNEFPDGKRYKTLKSAKAWCRKHAPAMYLAGKLGGDDE